LIASEHRGSRDDSPSDHDPGDPTPSPNLPKQQIAGHLKQQVAEVKDPVAEIKNRVAQPKIVLHLKPGKADIRSVEDVEDVKQTEKRHQPPGDYT
jgi:hypothetical protein